MDAAEASAIMEVLFQQVPDIEEQVAAATAAAAGNSAPATPVGGGMPGTSNWKEEEGIDNDNKYLIGGDKKSNQSRRKS